MGVLIIAGFFSLMSLADRSRPEQREVRIELPGAIRD
jgi:hypothetical protein